MGPFVIVHSTRLKQAAHNALGLGTTTKVHQTLQPLQRMLSFASIDRSFSFTLATMPASSGE